MAPSKYDNQNSKGSFRLPTEITYIFRKIEGYTPSGLGSRLFTVDRLAGWQTKIYCSLKFLKFESGPS